MKKFPAVVAALFPFVLLSWLLFLYVVVHVALVLRNLASLDSSAHIFVSGSLHRLKIRATNKQTLVNIRKENKIQQ